MAPNSSPAAQLAACNANQFASTLATLAPAYTAMSDHERNQLRLVALTSTSKIADELTRNTAVGAVAKFFGLSRPDVRKEINARRKAYADANRPAPVLPKIAYDGKNYWRPILDGRMWQPMSRVQALVDLECAGFSRDKDEDASLSAAERMLDQLERTNYVVSAGPVGGVAAGVREMCGRPFLVTDSPRPLASDPHETDDGFERFLRELLGCGADPDGPRQYHTFRLWLRQARLALASEIRMEVPILCLVGPAGQGKSVLGTLLGNALGGRTTSAYAFFGGEDKFNLEVVGSDLLILGDEVSKASGAERDAFAERLKNWVSNPSARMRGICANGVEVSPRSPIYLSANMDCAASLPPLADASFAERIIYLRTRSLAVAPNDGTPEAKDVWFKFMTRGLKKMLHEVENMSVAMDPMHDRRWGVKAFHHAEIVQALTVIDPNAPLAELIDIFLRSAPNDTAERKARGFSSCTTQQVCSGWDDVTWSGNSSELYVALLRHFPAIGGWVKNVNHLGRVMGRLAAAREYSARIRQSLGHENKSVWCISLRAPVVPISAPAPVACAAHISA